MILLPNPETLKPFAPLDQARLDVFMAGCDQHASSPGGPFKSLTGPGHL